VFLATSFSVVMLVLLAQGGARRIVGVVCGAAILTWMLSRWEKMRLRTLFAASIAAMLVVLLMQYLLEYRNIGYRGVFSSTESSRLESIHVDDNILRVGQIIDLVPKAHDFVYEKYLTYLAARPLPRVLWPGKPVDFGIDVPALLGVRGVSLSSSIVGE